MRRDGCKPVERDPNCIIVGPCVRVVARKPGAPVFTPRIQNTVDSCEVSQFWSEETGELVITDDEQFIRINNSCEADGPDPFGIFPGCGECAEDVVDSDAFWADEDFVLVVTDDNQNIIIDNRF